jgi:hypothetical protein
MRPLLAGLALTAMTGCATPPPSTPAALISNPDQVQQVTVAAADYRSVYRATLAAARKCLVTSYHTVSGDLFDDSGRAEITYQIAGFRPYVLATAEIIRRDNGTEVRAYIHARSPDVHFDRWATGTTTC